MTRTMLIVALLLLSGCSLDNVHLYKSESLSISDQAILSSVGIYDDRKLGLQILAINGETVEQTRAASFILPAGTYQIKMTAKKDLTIVPGGSPTGGLAVSIKHAELTVPVLAVGGHTYIPDAQVDGNRIVVYFVDKGPNYPTECLPLYRLVNGATGNPGLMAYRTDKKCTL